MEGLWGFLLWLVILPILQAFKCSHPTLCPYGSLENISLAFKQISYQPLHFLWIALIIIIIPIIYVCSVNVTKLGSAAQRATIECAAIPLVWVWFMTVPIRWNELKQKYDYDEEFTVLQLIGFIILFCGVLLYNELVVLRFWGFDKNTLD